MFINVFETLKIGGNKVATIAGILDPLYMNFGTSEGFLFEKNSYFGLNWINFQIPRFTV